MSLHVQVVSPERVLWSGEAEMVTTRILEGGDITFLPGHIPYLAALDIARLVIRPAEGADIEFAVHGGFVELSHDRISILSDVAETHEDIDVERARAALGRAEKVQETDLGDPVAAAALKRAKVRLAVAESGVDA